jgi:hypothetical protein
MEGLLKVSGCDSPNRVADVIFVHGLDGDARTTWRPKDMPEAFWPAWLGEDFPAVGVWSLNYAVSSSAWKGHSMPLVDRAKNTLDLLELDQIGRRPVAFVCHSLGGLLVKQMLRLARDSLDPTWRGIVDQTALIVFLSTPHSGADIASWMQYLGKLLRTTVSIEELEAHHPQLRDLNDWYRDNVGVLGIKTFVYCEKLPTGGILVVNETTANPGIPGVRVIPVDEDHVSICKPVSKESQIYRRVKRLIEEIVTASRPSAENPSGLDLGKAKINLCRRLGLDWEVLADYFEIPAADRARFEKGWEPQRVWEWLESRGKLTKLAEALRYIDREDLLQELPEHPR